MAEVGYAANRRRRDAERMSHDPADGAAALEALTSPVITHLHPHPRHAIP